MNQELIDKLNKTLEERKNGILLSDDTSDPDLGGLLEVADRLSSIHFSNIPTPNKQRKYLEIKNTSTFKLFKISAWPVFLILLGFFGMQAFEKSQQSLPGNTLYSIKKLSEKAEVYTVSKNPTKLAQTHLDITERRISETQIVLNSKDYDEAVKAKVLEELSRQTKTTLPLVLDAVNSSEKPDSELVQNLDNLNRRLAELKTSTKDQSVALNKEVDNVISESKKTTDQAKTIIAAQNESALTLLAKDTVEVTGKVVVTNKNTLVVEKSTFTYDSSKLIIRRVNGPASIKDLISGSIVEIKGVRLDSGSLEAKEVVIKESPKQDTNINSGIDSSKDEAVEDALIEQVPIQNAVQAGFLIENPNPETPIK